MEFKLKNKKIAFNPIRIVFLLICIYLLVLTSPYWINKFQILLVNDNNIDWIPEEVMQNGSVWGASLSPDHDILILPTGQSNFRVYYKTELYSMSGFWGAVPKISISDNRGFNYTYKTVDPVETDVFPDAVNQTRKVQPYLSFSLDTSKDVLHKLITANTELELKYPQKIAMSFNFEYTKSKVNREFKMFFVSQDEYLTIKKLFQEDIPEMTITPLIRGFISLGLLFLIVFNLKSLFKKVSN